MIADGAPLHYYFVLFQQQSLTPLIHIINMENHGVLQHSFWSHGMTRGRSTHLWYRGDSDKLQAREFDTQMKKDAENTVCPPRVSFGVAIEFMIGVYSGRDPDLEIDGHLPPQSDGGDDILLKVSTLLQGYGIETYVPSDSEERDVSKLHMWAVTSDESIDVDDKEGSGYAWKDVELTSPASYAFDEAFNMIKVVLSLVTANFRCRVNSCVAIRFSLVSLGDRPKNLGSEMGHEGMLVV
ncbi:hypothetical protein EDB80DRAFT_364546 [Ilyonectria destructans]|nr:hypothetical protein EDB80DRAFT_364546 [Ilyonectria destructans]